MTYFAVLFDDMEGDSTRGCLAGGAGVDDPLFTHDNVHPLNLLVTYNSHL